MDDRYHYYEQPCIIEQRHTRLHEEKRRVAYLDETWANPHDSKDCAWVERDDVIAGTLDDGLDEELVDEFIIQVEGDSDESDDSIQSDSSDDE